MKANSRQKTGYKLIEQKNKGRQIHLTPDFEKSLGLNKQTGVQTLRFILKNMKVLGLMPLVDPLTGIRIENTYTGAYAGGEGITYKVTYCNKNFFLKLIRKHIGQNSPRAYVTLEKTLAKIGNKAGRYRVELIKPHLIYTPRSMDSFCAVLTDFYEKGTVIHLDKEGINEKEYEKRFKRECDFISRLAQKNSIVDVERHNMFFDKKRKTILLFDPS